MCEKSLTYCHIRTYATFLLQLCVHRKCPHCSTANHVHNVCTFAHMQNTYSRPSLIRTAPYQLTKKPVQINEFVQITEDMVHV